MFWGSCGRESFVPQPADRTRARGWGGKSKPVVTASHGVELLAVGTCCFFVLRVGLPCELI